MRSNDRLGNHQAETRSIGQPLPRRFDPIEPVKKTRQMFGRDTIAGIFHGQPGALYDVLTPEQRAVLDRGPVAQGPRFGWSGR